MSDLCLGIRTAEGEAFRVVRAGYASWACLTPSFLSRCGPRWDEVMAIPTGAPEWHGGVLLMDFANTASLWSSDYSADHALRASLTSTEGLRQFGACSLHFEADTAIFFTETADAGVPGYHVARTVLSRQDVAGVMNQFTNAGAVVKEADESFVFRDGAAAPAGMASIFAMLGIKPLPELPESLMQLSLVAVPTGWAMTAIDPRHSQRTAGINSFLSRHGWRARVGRA